MLVNEARVKHWFHPYKVSSILHKGPIISHLVTGINNLDCPPCFYICNPVVCLSMKDRLNPSSYKDYFI